MGLFGLSVPSKLLSAAGWISALKADLTLVEAGPPRARVSRSTNQSIADNSATEAISFDAADYNVGGFWVIGQPTRLTIPSTGQYRLTVDGQFAFNAAGWRSLSFVKNAATPLGSQNVNPIGGGGSPITEFSYSIEVPLAAGDYVQALAYQNSGGALNLLAVSGVTPYVSIVKLG